MPYCGKRFWMEVGIWWVQKRFPRYGVPIWSLWPNIRFLPSIVAEKNATKNEHICSMCIKINKVGKQEVGIMAEIWYLVKSIISVYHIVGSVFGPVRFLLPVCQLSWFLYTLNIPVYAHFSYQISAINSYWEKYDEKYLGRTDGRTEVKQYTPLPLRGAGV
jgi:hypothetical protein